MVGRLTLPLVLLVAASLTPPAYAADVSAVVITHYGTIQDKGVDRTVKAPGTISGRVTLMKDARLVEQTDRIPATMGTQFGVFYNVIGEPEGAKVPLTIKFTTPGLRGPGAKEPRYVEQWEATSEIGEKVSWTYYAFEHEWELVPGTWTIELYYKDRKLAEQSFEVYKP